MRIAKQAAAVTPALPDGKKNARAKRAQRGGDECGDA
jgi:hypothetical protein